MTHRSRLAWASVSLLASFLILFGLQSPAWAQTTAVAEVSGTVTDSSGAVIPGAQVSMTETDKGLTHTVSTNSAGRYALPNLPVGPYRLEVKSSGFRDYVESGIVLVVNNNIEINVTMQVGPVTQRVEVQASKTMVEVKETSVSSLVDEQRIDELPLNNRQATQLIITLGAAVYADSGDTGSKTFWNGTRISVAGGQGNGTAYLLDGGDATDPMLNVNMPFPFPDALQEFSVETSAVSSRFGTHPGATVNVVTKSGSNAFHGDLFEYLRNGDLDARNFFAKTHDTLRRNQFGGTAGGKIIPDKLFYFGGYQGTRNRSAPPTSITHIPTAAMLGGDFSGVAGAGCQSSGKVLQLKNPSGGTFTNNQIPTTMFDPVAVALVTKYLPVSAVTDPCGTVTFSIPQTGDEDEYIGRVDYAISPKHNLFGRYFLDGWSNPPHFTPGNILVTTAAGNYERAQSATIGETYTISATTLNSLHLAWNRIRDNRGPTNTPINWTDLGSSMYSTVPNFLLISSMTGGFTTFCGTCAPGHFNMTSEQVADDVDLIRGKHEISLGFNLIRIQNDTISGFDENGAPTFNGSFTGLGMADFMLGLMSDFIQTNATPDDLRQWVMSFYAQDSFKISPHFTFNYGLRWQPTFADIDKYRRGTSFSMPGFLANQFSTVHPTAPAGLFFPGDAGIPPGNWNGHLPNFAPRVGLVWNPSGTGRDTLRIGAAILYDTTETWFNERETTNAPFGNSIDVGSTGTLSNPWAGYPGGNPFPQKPGNLFFPHFGAYVNMPVNPRPTYMVQWNATYQRQFKGNWVASISYMGNETTHLWITHESDPATYIAGEQAANNGCTIDSSTKLYPISCTKTTNQRRLLYLTNPTQGVYYAGITTADDGAVARYEGLLLSGAHRFSQNYTAIANFTDAYCRSDYDWGPALATAYNSQPFNRQADWGKCVSDTRLNFNLSLVAHSPWKLASPAGRILNNWELAPLIHASGGQPLLVVTGTDNSLTGLGNDRPNFTGQSPFAGNVPCAKTAPCLQFLNPAAFTPNPTGTYGDLARNAVRGPDYFGFDLALSRTLKLSERFGLEVRAEAFNILNHPSFVGQFAPSGQPPGTTYGTLSQALNASTFGQITGAYDPRILQFALKVHF